MLYDVVYISLCRDELESIQGFASGLPVESWASFKLEMLNRPTGPVLILIFKKWNDMQEFCFQEGKCLNLQEENLL